MSFWIVAAAGLAVGSFTVSEFERAASRDIKAQLKSVNAKVKTRATFAKVYGPLLADAATVTIRASEFRVEGVPLYVEPDRSKYGRIRTLKLLMSDFYLRDLRCHTLTAEIPSCRFDFGLATSKKQFRLSQSGVGSGTVKVMLSDLEAFALKKFRELKTVNISTEGNWLRVQGRGTFLVFDADFEVQSRVRAKGPHIYLEDAIVTLNGERAGPEEAASLLMTLNPLVDFDKDLGLLDAVDGRAIVLAQDSISLIGSVKIPTRP